MLLKSKGLKRRFATSLTHAATSALSTLLLLSITLLLFCRTAAQQRQVPDKARLCIGLFPLQFYKLGLKSLSLCSSYLQSHP